MTVDVLEFEAAQTDTVDIVDEVADLEEGFNLLSVPQPATLTTQDVNTDWNLLGANFPLDSEDIGTNTTIENDLTGVDADALELFRGDFSEFLTPNSQVGPFEAYWAFNPATSADERGIASPSYDEGNRRDVLGQGESDFQPNITNIETTSVEDADDEITLDDRDVVGASEQVVLVDVTVENNGNGTDVQFVTLEVAPQVGPGSSFELADQTGIELGPGESGNVTLAFVASQDDVSPLPSFVPDDVAIEVTTEDGDAEDVGIPFDDGGITVEDQALSTGGEFGVENVDVAGHGTVQLVDANDNVLDSVEFAQYADPIPEGTAASLLLEYDSELVDDFEAAVGATNDHFVEHGAAFDALEAYADEDQRDLWKLRKAAIPLLMGLEGDPKPYPFIEDATVPPEELAEYVGQFEAVLESHGTSAAYFAHAGSGTLHIRPILNLKEQGGIEKMRSISDDVTDLVLEHHGAFSGEHGDGMARTEFNPKMYGEGLWTAFKRLKTAFDPQWLLHPGNVVYRDGPDDVGPDSERGVGADMRENLRYGADYQSVEPQTTLDFDDEGGFSHLVELCNGCGTCRQTDSEVMCPTYRATKEEIQTTRGRANMLRAAISGELPEDEIHADRFQEEVLDLCIGCKGCASDCPTGVDMAKLKTEVKHQHHQEEGVSPRERLFSNIDVLSRLGSTFAPVSNWAPRVPGARRVMQELFGIAPERTLPEFASTSLVSWFDDRGGCRLAPGDARDQVLLFPDTFTNYIDPSAGKAAVEVLEAAGVYAEIPTDLAPSGRAAYSTGRLDLARDRARENVDSLRDRVEAGWSVVFVEPSDAVVFQDEYRDVLSGPGVEAVSNSAYGVLEYLDAHRLDDALGEAADPGSLAYHGHCNQKATNKDHHAVGVLRRAGYDVDPLDSTCCGMAGSFGYHDEHYGLSQAIGSLLFDQVDESPAERVVAPGGSCRSQLGDRDGAEKPPHPVEAVADAVAR